LEKVEYEYMSSREEAHWWWRARREILAEVIARYAPKKAPAEIKVAEIGCGTGGNLPMLARFGNVLGVEHEPVALDRLREKFGTTYQVIRHSVPEPLPGTFDVLALFDVLEHIADDVAAMEWVSRQLNVGGIAVVTVPAFPFLWTEHDEAHHHFRRYTEDSLRKVVPPALQVVHASYFNTVLFAPIAAVRSVLRLLPRRTGTARAQRTPEFLDEILYRLFRLERKVVHRRRLPFGVSLLAVLRRVSA
jgi:SAM-dependent methyltransferase